MALPPTPTPAVEPAAEAVGIFEGHGRRQVLHPGSVDYDATARSYTVAGSGENMWAARDAFHYAWKKAAGDLALAADIAFPGAGTEAASQGVLDDPPEPGRRLGLRRCRAPRRRPDVAAIPRGQAPPRTRSSRTSRPEAAAHREARQVRP